MQDSLEQKTRALLDKYKSGAFDADPERKARAKAALSQLRDQLRAPSPAADPRMDRFSTPMTQDPEFAGTPEGPKPEPTVWEKMAQDLRLGESRFNAGLGGMVSGLADLPQNVLNTLGVNEPLTQGMARSLSEAGHSVGDPLQGSLTFQAPQQEQQATTERLGTAGTAIFGDLPGMAPAALGGPAAAELIAAQTLSQQLSPEAQAQADAQGASGWQRAANVVAQTGIAYGAGKFGPLGNRAAAGSALDELAGRGVQNFTVTAGQSEASQGAAHALLGTPIDHDASVRAGIAGVGLGAGLDAVNPHPVQPDTAPGKVQTISEPMAFDTAQEAAMHPPDTVGVGDMLGSLSVQRAREQAPKDLNAIVDHLRAQTPNASNPPGTLQFVSEPTSKEMYDGPKSALDMQGALWAGNENLRNLAVTHETVSNPTIKRQARQELEDTLKQHLTDEQVASIAKWRYWAADNAEATKAAQDALAPKTEASATVSTGPERTEPISLKEILPTPDDAKQHGEWMDTWKQDRNEAIGQVNLRSRSHLQDLEAAVPPESLTEAIQRIAQTGRRLPVAVTQRNDQMAAYISLKNDPSALERTQSSLSPEKRLIVQEAQNLPPQVKAMAEQIASENKDQGKLLQDAGLMDEYKDYYSAQLWKPRAGDEGSMPPEGTSKFTLTSGRTKQRVYPTILDGWADGRELAVPGAIEAQAVAARQAHQLIADKKMMTLGLKIGSLSTEPGEGLVRVEHPNFRVRADITKDDGTVEPGFKPVYASKEDAGYLNNVLGTSALNKWPAAKAFSDFGNALKQTFFFGSGVHYFNLLRAHVITTPTSLSTLNPLEPLNAWRAGQDMLKHPAADLNDLMRNGMTFGNAGDMEAAVIADRTMIGKHIDDFLAKLPDGGFTKASVDASRNTLLFIRDAQHHFMFSTVRDAWKAYDGQINYNKELLRRRDDIMAGKLTRDDVAEYVGKQMNNIYGGQNLLMHGRNPTAQHIARMGLLAPDWREGLARLGASPLKPGFEGEFAKILWGRIGVRVLAGAAVGNAVLASLDDKTYKQRFMDAYNSGNGGAVGLLRALTAFNVSAVTRKFGIGDAGVDHYVSLGGAFTTPFDATLSPIANAIFEAGKGTDWKGAQFTSARELFGLDNKGVYSKTGVQNGKLEIAGQNRGGQLEGQTSSDKSEEKSGMIGPNQAPSWALHQMAGMLPTPIQSIIAWHAGQIDGLSAIVKSIGVGMSQSNQGSVMERLMRRDAAEAQTLGEKKAAEAQLKVYNATRGKKALQGH